MGRHALFWLCGLAALTAAAFPSPADARMYKCTDSQGRVYYTDRLTPDCVQQGPQEMNKRGIVVREYEAGQVPGGRPVKREEPRMSPEQEREAMERERRDRALLATYASEREIDLARDRNLKQAELALASLKAREKSAAEKVGKLKADADKFAGRGKPVPEWLSEELAHAERELSVLKAQVAAKEGEMDAIRARFEADKARYRELKGR